MNHTWTMTKKLIILCFSLLIIYHHAVPIAAELPRVELKTSMGTLVLELDQVKAPRTVANFLDYVRNGFYDNFIFHRVVKGFVIQSGAYDKDLVEYETNGPIRNEAANGLKNLRGTVAMARYGDPHSADSQFFINLSDNPKLDHKSRTLDGYGYCVFGRVIRGMEVVDAIGNVETHALNGFEDVPVEPVFIERASILDR